jgi:hypothetical protein
MDSSFRDLTIERMLLSWSIYGEGSYRLPQHLFRSWVSSKVSWSGVVRVVASPSPLPQSRIESL